MTTDQMADLERRIVSAARVGELVDLRVGDPEHDNAASGATWTDDRTVRSELLIQLLAAEATAGASRPRYVKIRGARITGSLDLEACALACPLLLHDCYIEQIINVESATASIIRLPGCHLPGVWAEQLHTTGNFELDESIIAGPIDLRGARIGGSLSFSSARLSNHDEITLAAQTISVEQDMHFDGFIAEGQVIMDGAEIGGTLYLNEASLISPGTTAFAAMSLTVKQNVVCGPSFSAEGEVNLLGARIGGLLMFPGAQLSNPGKRALVADGLTIEGSMFCRNGFTANGEVRLLSAHIGGQLTFDGAQLSNPGKCALNADGLTVQGGMFCRDGFTATGEVRLLGAHIGSDLEFDKASLVNPDGHALNADRMIGKQNVFCRQASVEGTVGLLAANVAGNISFTGTSLNNPEGYALDAEKLLAGGSILCREGFTAKGQVSLFGVQVGSALDFEEAILSNPRGVALDLGNASAAELTLHPAQLPDGGVNLTGASVGSFDDDQATWPVAMLLRGFTYKTLENDQISVKARLAWLKLHASGYIPQIYDQLAATYQRAGHVEAARRVGVAKQWRRRRLIDPFNWLLYLTIGYGYRTWLAALWLAAITLLGTRVFTVAEADHLMQATANAPAFHPMAYTLDILLPIVDLDQQKAWAPQNWAQIWSWALIAAGWYLTTAAVAGLTGVFKRD